MALKIAAGTLGTNSTIRLTISPIMGSNVRNLDTIYESYNSLKKEAMFKYIEIENMKRDSAALFFNRVYVCIIHDSFRYAPLDR